jgi:hypothetical protein
MVEVKRKSCVKSLTLKFSRNRSSTCNAPNACSAYPVCLLDPFLLLRFWALLPPLHLICLGRVPCLQAEKRQASPVLWIPLHKLNAELYAAVLQIDNFIIPSYVKFMLQRYSSRTWISHRFLSTEHFSCTSKRPTLGILPHRLRPTCHGK